MIYYKKLIINAINAVKEFEIKPKTNLLLKSFLIFLPVFMISGCSGPEGRPCSRSEDACLIVEPPRVEVEVWWNAPLPDFSKDQNRPTISLLGDRTQILSLGEFYLEEGAIAIDEQDGDISSQIEIKGQVNINKIGDYLLRYYVTDSNNIEAIEQTRIVRVIGSSVETFSRRPLGSSIANFGYLEYLPINYGQATEEKPPLLIYLHGGGGNMEFTNTTDPTLSLDAVIGNYGIPKTIEDGDWDDSLPFVVLAPQLGSIPDVGYKERLEAFFEFAIRAYDIDISRIYLVGYSQGGLLSGAYSKDFPDDIAAAVSISPAFSDTSSSATNFCDIERVPYWMFHASNDDVIPFVNTQLVYFAILDNCQPSVLPKFSLVRGGEHAIHHAVLNLEAMDGGSVQAVYDSRFDSYDVSIYQWLLSHSLNDR